MRTPNRNNANNVRNVNSDGSLNNNNANNSNGVVPDCVYRPIQVNRIAIERSYTHTRSSYPVSIRQVAKRTEEGENFASDASTLRGGLAIGHS